MAEKIKSHLMHLQMQLIKVISFLRRMDLEVAVLYIVLFAGGILAVLQFVFNRSLWLDEAMLAWNILHRSPAELLQPLDFWVVAPILYLQLEKFMAWVIPNSEMGLRLLSLLSYLGSIFLFGRFVRDQNFTKYVQIFCVSLFAFDSSLIYYASEVKQYMTDILVVLFVYSILLSKYENIERQYLHLMVIGSIAIFLSNISPLILSTVATYLVYKFATGVQHNLKGLLLLFTVWGVLFVIDFFLFIYQHPATGPMVAYWSGLGAFLPLNPFDKSFYVFLWDKWYMVSWELFHFGISMSKILFALFLIGLGSLIWRRYYGTIILLLMPVTLHLSLSAFKYYPVDMRLILYTTPLFSIVFAYGLQEVLVILFSDLNIRRFRLLALIIPIGLASSMNSNGFYGTPFPFKKEEMRSVLKHIIHEQKSKDGVYVFCAGIHQFNYYRDIHFFEKDSEFVLIGNAYDQMEKYVEEILTLKGRQWIVFSHVGGEEQYILERLKQLGYHTVDEFRDTGASCYLFDFG